MKDPTPERITEVLASLMPNARPLENRYEADDPGFHMQVQVRPDDHAAIALMVATLVHHGTDADLYYIGPVAMGGLVVEVRFTSSLAPTLLYDRCREALRRMTPI
jgi:hypothetical protein